MVWVLLVVSLSGMSCLQAEMAEKKAPTGPPLGTQSRTLQCIVIPATWEA